MPHKYRQQSPRVDQPAEELRRLLLEKEVALHDRRVNAYAEGATLVPPDNLSSPWESDVAWQSVVWELPPQKPSSSGHGASTFLLCLEVLALVAFGLVIWRGAGILRELNAGPAPSPILNTAPLPSASPEPTASPTATPEPLTVLPGDPPDDSSGPADGLLPPLRHTPSTIPPTEPAPDPVQSLSTPSKATSTPLSTQPASNTHTERILIPALKLDAPVLQGDGWEELKQGVGQHLGTPDPGQIGNIVLSAHDDIYGSLFRHLDKLRPGDEITLRTADKSYTYKVEEVRIVKPTQLEVLEQTPDAVLTLISCYPYLIDTQRIVVRASLATQAPS